MKSLIHLLLPASALALCVSAGAGNSSDTASSGNLPQSSLVIDSLAQYRDTLVGRFNGLEIDTLVCEPAGKPLIDELFGKLYLEWRVYTTRNTVKEFKVGNTIGLNFVEEGDLDGNGTEEWGFIGEWVSSTWTSYSIFTAVNGKWKLLIEPTRLWMNHLEPKDEYWPDNFTADEIARPSDRKGYVRIKYSDVINDVTEWVVVDTVTRVKPRKYTYELVRW